MLSSITAHCKFTGFLFTFSKVTDIFMMLGQKSKREHCNFTEKNGFKKPSFLLEARQILERFKLSG